MARFYGSGGGGTRMSSVFGLADEKFIRGNVPMTKAEIRALVMVKAGIRPEDTVVDIGAGTGSISIEAALAATKGKVYAIERNPEGVELIRRNAEQFTVKHRMLCGIFRLSMSLLLEARVDNCRPFFPAWKSY